MESCSTQCQRPHGPARTTLPVLLARTKWTVPSSEKGAIFTTFMKPSEAKRLAVKRALGPWEGSHKTSVHASSSPVTLKHGTLVADRTPLDWALEQPTAFSLPRGKRPLAGLLLQPIPESSSKLAAKGEKLEPFKGAAQAGRSLI